MKKIKDQEYKHVNQGKAKERRAKNDIEYAQNPHLFLDIAKITRIKGDSTFRPASSKIH